MTRTIEVVYEGDVLKPLGRIEGIKKHQKMWVILCPRPVKKALRELVGTLPHKEAEEMQKLIDEEFGKILAIH